MNWLKTFFKQLFCKHEFEHLRDIHGEEINVRGGYRSVWKCSKCEDSVLRPHLNKF